MAELVSPSGILPPIPDDLTLVQFTLDCQHNSSPVRKHGAPRVIEDHTSGKAHRLEELRARSFGLANGMNIKFNTKEKDAVLVFSANHLDYLVVVWAIHKLGPGANLSFTPDELAYQLKATQASVLVDHPDGLLVVRSAARILFDTADMPPTQGVFPTVQGFVDQGLSALPSFSDKRLSPGEGKTRIAFLNFSSGTTGQAKAVAIPHYAPIANIIQLAVHNRASEDLEVVLPLDRIYSMLSNAHYIFFCGMTVVLTTAQFNIPDFLFFIIRRRITRLKLVPPQAVTLCKVSQHILGRRSSSKAIDSTPLSHIMTLAKSDTQWLERHLALLETPRVPFMILGSRESCVVISVFPVGKKRDTSGSAGQILPDITARVERSDGTLADCDEPGELVVKTPSLTLGYAGKLEATQETFDSGREMLKVRGFQVAPAELEGCILGHPDVGDTCVVGIPDEYSGELPVAFVVPRPEAGKRARNPDPGHDIKRSIAKHVADHKAAYKRLDGVEFIVFIPKKPSGKLFRRVLRDRAQPRAIAKL
ncbi:phenylacetyl-CoA ligase [Pisolithus croceorrhizus]|nr:phenylacetyl-CoA ligase [Pisolithus croceorrhizus]